MTMPKETRRVWQRTQAVEVLKGMEDALSKVRIILAQGSPGYRPAPSAIRKELERVAQYLERSKERVRAVPVTQLEKQQRRAKGGV